MAEQEKGEKEIEMGRHLCPKFEIYCSDCGEDCNIADHCSLLIDAGYRKEEEVRKETAKDIFDRLEKYIIAAIDDKLLESYVRGLFLLERKHFGVKVEE